MKDATITQDQPAQESLYQQGKYISIVDTDDLVFEMGKQVVDRLNKDKLLDAMIKKSKMLEDAMIEAGKSKATAEKKATELELSNKQYVENNQRLDDELVNVRNELGEMREAMIKLENKSKELEKKNSPMKTIKKKKV